MTITLQSISKTFGPVAVVNNVSFEVKQGELFVLLGASGSGKSTILRLIAGLATPDSGKILLNSVDVTHTPVQKRDIGFVFQHYAIFKHMNVYENVEFGLRVRGVSKNERRKKSEELLDLTGLSGLGDRMPAQLSGGQRQRVALARALAYNPKVLLLDEPFGALDVRIRGQLRQSLKDLQRKLNITTILVTHDQEEAFELGDRIGVFDRGRLVESALADRLYHHPRTEFVATFVGNGNVFVGRAQGNEINLGAIKVPFPPDAPAHEEGSPVRVLFRPEHVICQATEFLGQSKIIPLGQGRLIRRSFVGPVERLSLEVPQLQGARQLAPAQPYGQRLAVIDASLTSGAHSPLTENQQVWIGLNRFHVLEPTGFHFLAYTVRRNADSMALSLGLSLSKATHGFLRLLSLLDAKGDAKSAEEEIKKYFLPSSHREVKLRTGFPGREVLRESQETHYDMVILDGTEQHYPPRNSLDVLARRVITFGGVPVVIAQSEWKTSGRILICTAAGEPGKADVRVGARLARHTNSPVTIFHVARHPSSHADEVRVTRHMEQALDVLKSVNVEGTIKVVHGDFLASLLKEISEGNYDLVILGAPGGTKENIKRGEFFVRAVITQSKVNVLIVPMSA